MSERFPLPLALDVGMIVALLSLSYWTGTQAQQVKELSVQVQSMDARLNSVASQSTAADIAGLKEKNLSQDQTLIDLKELIVQRLDRIERKIDKGR